MGNLINGVEISNQVKEEVKQQVDEIVASGKRAPSLVVFMVGDDPRSAKYVSGKKTACEKAGIKFTLVHLPAETTQEDLEGQVISYNNDDSVDGILVQLPLPNGLDEERVTELVSPNKDVDGLTKFNSARLFSNEACLAPATPSGIMRILEAIDVDVTGKNVVILGRGKLVGKPLMLLMLNHNATVTICHSHTENLTEITQNADILVVGIGKDRYINKSFIKEGAIVIDAGINVDEFGKLHGDCDYLDMLDKCSWITPVPKGVGPMTIAMLLDNVVKAYHLNEAE